jgi:hypothetical protein
MSGEVLSKAWSAIIRNPILWLFGILAGCAGQSSGLSSNVSRFYFPQQNTQTPSALRQSQMPQPEFVKNFDKLLKDIPAEIWAGLAVFAIVLALAAFFLSAIGKAGLVRGVYLFDNGQEELGFGLILSEAMSRFGQMLLLSLVVGVILGVGILVLMLGVGLISAATMGVGALCFIPLICLAAPLSWFINMVVNMATVAVAGEKADAITSLRAGIKITQENWGMLLITSILLGIIQLIFSVIILLPGFFIFPEMIVSAAKVNNFAPVLIMAALYALPAIPLFGGITAYTECAWALTFRRLISPSPASNIPIYPQKNR